MGNDNEGVIGIYGTTGFIVGIIAGYAFEWPIWAVLVSAFIGPIVLGVLLLVGFFIWWGIVGD
jgi:hypothetical protein